MGCDYNLLGLIDVPACTERPLREVPNIYIEGRDVYVNGELYAEIESVRHDEGSNIGIYYIVLISKNKFMNGQKDQLKFYTHKPNIIVA